jgi:pyridoxamine 5'-phosphate oxidase
VAATGPHTMSRMVDPRAIRAPSGFHSNRPLEREDLVDDPVEQFRQWLDTAGEAGVPLPNAMALATTGADGRPTLRHVLLRGVDERGFTFFTNRDSRKGRELADNPHAALVFLWKELDRQVEVDGAVEPTSDEESDAYFSGRPRGAQLGAWASPQSSVIGSREELMRRVAEMQQRFGDGDVPRPPSWGGFRLVPDRFEFWQGSEHRLHDRFAYTRIGDGWRIDRLAP